MRCDEAAEEHEARAERDGRGERASRQRQLLGLHAHLRVVPRVRVHIEVDQRGERRVRPRVSDAADTAVDPEFRADEHRRVPLARRWQAARRRRAPRRRARPYLSVEAQHVHVVVVKRVVRAADKEVIAGDACERGALAPLGRCTGGLCARPRALLCVEEVDGVRVGAGVATEDGEDWARRGTGDMGGRVGRASGGWDARPRQRLCVQADHVVEAA